MMLAAQPLCANPLTHCHVLELPLQVLGLDWRLGAEYFACQLIDHDWAVNLGNWSYNAGGCWWWWWWWWWWWVLLVVVVGAGCCWVGCLMAPLAAAAGRGQQRQLTTTSAPCKQAPAL